MKVDAFDFELPAELIAERPAEPRDSARLLVVGNDGFADRQVADLADLLSPGDLLVFNDTKVIPARLRGLRREAKVEATLHMRLGPGRWAAFARPAKRLKPSDRIDFAEDFHATVAEKGEAGEITLDFDREGAALDEAIAAHGELPLPPYIASRRAVDRRDLDDYQTMFAEKSGAVAAPTAGLHFTPGLIGKLSARDIGHLCITLHVGAGTFLPVKADDTDEHRMHSEIGVIAPDHADRINAVRAGGGRIVAVGTTSLRLLESAADETGQVQPFSGATDIFITPGYRFRAVDLLITNFHLPRSTLFMLVSAFSGLERMRAAYGHAIDRRYRFYSYGDAALLFPGS
ncbi:tRNA preQ1(34) S-adenosylmethionine ribosyltransferase-isomerase QueA [Oceanibacterium hippocampi]|uniref:S-adenosylmethionine:tRNA ribosyltransferase-isomerase n=1 Tax=Oceanibacterium hippocampi TaxID=745714 RepID=A0A1Y5TA64_9PROT|nr:tRNA preQ1(34) S-adenosylmethionine ribosyltransferase-isomerase QueA [Oceanibacterium hippocampi]SLN55776.1 S-adenosylmethionine:tRNA ribosyltransferase-isomerase [Oceanibacterium hippocampi]